jgi:hypothetical protein
MNVQLSHLDIIHHPVFYLKHDILETRFFLQNTVFLKKDRIMDNVQNYDSYINIYHHKPI